MQSNGESPVFLQFLDCVRQMVVQRPEEFEFGLLFLEDLAFYSSLGCFVELVYDNEKTRHENCFMLSFFSFFEFYRSTYRANDLRLEETGHLKIRVEDFYMDVWRELFLGNFPYDEKNLFC